MPKRKLEQQDESAGENSKSVKRATSSKKAESSAGEKPKRAPVASKKTTLSASKFDAKEAAALFPGFSIATQAPSKDSNDCFSFSAAADAPASLKSYVSKFRPNRSPEQILRAGAFGGTYFRPIQSGVVKQKLSTVWKELPAEWIEGLAADVYLARPWAKYDVKVNKYGVKCGQTLEEWESSGWISSYDPFGWFQWYCRFFQGRRCDDDERQISRWLKCCGPTGRWLGNLVGKVCILSIHPVSLSVSRVRVATSNRQVYVAGAPFDDPSVSPVVRQTLLHWYVMSLLPVSCCLLSN